MTHGATEFRVRVWDSLGHMNMVGAIEEEFGLEFEVDEITEMTSAGKILEMIQTKDSSKN